MLVALYRLDWFSCLETADQAPAILYLDWAQVRPGHVGLCALSPRFFAVDAHVDAVFFRTVRCILLVFLGALAADLGLFTLGCSVVEAEAVEALHLIDILLCSVSAELQVEVRVGLYQLGSLRVYVENKHLEAVLADE